MHTILYVTHRDTYDIENFWPIVLGFKEPYIYIPAMAYLNLGSTERQK